MTTVNNNNKTITAIIIKNNIKKGRKQEIRIYESQDAIESLPVRLS